jgi:7-carboxy-7-deazaguanine synthase
MKIAEIFYSVQGEGSLLGAPSVFIRTSGCNLRCSWCDTPYTSWNPEGAEMTEAEIVDRVRATNAPYAVLTGGEPLIAPGAKSLIEKLHDLGMHVTIETAGTIYIEDLKCDLMSISPKLSNSTPEGAFRNQHERLRIQPETLQALVDNYDYQLKFVISESKDLEEVQALIGMLQGDPKKVILMPEGKDAQTLHDRSLWLVEVAKETGFRFSPRLHVDLWGNRRGV